MSDKVATRDGFGKELVKLGKENDKIVVVSADLEDATRAEYFRDAYPDRFFTVGIAEQDMVGTAAGLSQEGFIPFINSFAVLSTMGASDVSVFGTYGFTESRIAWAECPTPPGISSGYHVYPDKEIFEIIDPKTGEVKGEGEDGELVYTSIDSRASSLIRYRTGDFVKGGITYAPCLHCQRLVPRISSDITRISDVKDLNLSKIKGQLVNLNNFTRALSSFNEIKEWQLELRKKDNDPYEIDELILYICVEEGIDKNVLEKNLKHSILLATEVSPNSIIFISFDEIVKRLELETASKEKRIIDLRPQ